eukprot:CAMPEP_0179287146 /NCGR_PEP_ID=MMETSP0797-20121207/40114_1 /TAXON_ID=47934 /ORGANISM="Dinophysis acuminata, Strain DAEP01" /LENGTH=167 /DNA_ID=CAMNT_0020996067 /DNA_START=42 /DNA_END=542 /DNA_ORIENTATION=-
MPEHRGRRAPTTAARCSLRRSAATVGTGVHGEKLQPLPARGGHGWGPPQRRLRGARRRGHVAVLQDPDERVEADLAAAAGVGLGHELLHAHALEGLAHHVPEVLDADGAGAVGVEAAEGGADRNLAVPAPRLHRRREEVGVVDPLVAVPVEQLEELIEDTGVRPAQL